MNLQSTYELLNIPESVSSFLVTGAICFALAPWLSATEIGPWKLPNIPDHLKRPIKILGPILAIGFFSGFLRLWTPPIAPPPVTQERYVKEFFDPFFDLSIFEGQSLFYLPKEEADLIMTTLGGKKFTGHRFRTIAFEVNGRVATFQGTAEWGGLEVQACIGCGSSQKFVLIGGYTWGDVSNTPHPRNSNEMMGNVESGRIAIVVQLDSPNSVAVRYAASVTFADDYWTMSP